MGAFARDFPSCLLNWNDLQAYVARIRQEFPIDGKRMLLAWVENHRSQDRA